MEDTSCVFQSCQAMIWIESVEQLLSKYQQVEVQTKHVESSRTRSVASHVPHGNQSQRDSYAHDTLGWKQCKEQIDYHKKRVAGTEGGQWISVKIVDSHISSQVVSAIAMYSASELLRDTVCCFLDRHEIKESPRKTQYLVIDYRESGQAAQSAS